MFKRFRLPQLFFALALTATLAACTGSVSVTTQNNTRSISPVGRFGIDTDLIYCPAGQIKVCDRFGVALRDCQCRS